MPRSKQNPFICFPSDQVTACPCQQAKLRPSRERKPWERKASALASCAVAVLLSSAVCPSGLADDGSKAPPPVFTLVGQSDAPSRPGKASDRESIQTGKAPAEAPANSPEAGKAAAKGSLTIPAGTVLTLRLNQRIGVLTSRTGDLFTSRTAAPLPTEGKTTIPAGASVAGVVLHTRRRGRPKGESVLRLTLSGLNVGDQHYQIRATGAKGESPALGTLLSKEETTGMIFGSLTGSSTGTVTAGLTGTKDIDYPADTLLSFQLNTPLQLRP